ncbi:NUDIX domain-containing protein [Deltaproteobacteria bacterium TL4]
MYRSNVCTVIVNKKKSKVLVFHRKGAEKFGWQFPQGGVDQGETEKAAFYRELKEETGTNDVKVLKISKDRTKYSFPKWVREQIGRKGLDKFNKDYEGQEIRWFLVEFRGGGIDMIHFDHQPAEFDKYKWVKPKKAVKNVIPFKRKAYKAGLKSLGIL